MNDPDRKREVLKPNAAKLLLSRVWFCWCCVLLFVLSVVCWFVIRPQQKTKLVAKHNFETHFSCKCWHPIPWDAHPWFSSFVFWPSWALPKLISQGLTPTLHPFGLASTLVFLHHVLIGSLETCQSAFTHCIQGHLGWRTVLNKL